MLLKQLSQEPVEFHHDANTVVWRYHIDEDVDAVLASPIANAGSSLFDGQIERSKNIQQAGFPDGHPL